MDLKSKRKGAYSLLIRNPTAFEKAMTREQSPECPKLERKVFIKDARKKTQDVESSVARGYSSNMMQSWCLNDHSTQSSDIELNLKVSL